MTTKITKILRESSNQGRNRRNIPPKDLDLGNPTVIRFASGVNVVVTFYIYFFCLDISKLKSLKVKNLLFRK